MTTITLPPSHDPMGAAIKDFHELGAADTLHVTSSMFDDDEMPVAHLFRTAAAMPPLERKALAMTGGRVLDIGAGAGCHSLALQEAGLQVTAIDISPLSCRVMEQRGVADVRCLNIFDNSLSGTYDTLLLLMNGTGIAGKISRLPMLLTRLKALMAADGQILIDSSDLIYIYEEEDGSYAIDLNGAYYGEVDYQMTYKDIAGEPFDWLYVDFPLLKTIAAGCGLQCELVQEGDNYDYLARLWQE